MKKIIKFLPVIVFGVIVALPVYAALPTIVPKCALVKQGIPQLSCFLELLINVSKWILGISGSLALLLFVYGGFLLMTSRGSQEQVTKGKTILSRALIGVIIIFGAYTGISFLAKTLGFEKFRTDFDIIQPKTPAPAEKEKQKTTECDCYCRQTEKTGANHEKIYNKETSASEAACKKTCESLGDWYWKNQKFERCDPI